MLMLMIEFAHMRVFVAAEKMMLCMTFAAELPIKIKHAEEQERAPG